MDILFLFSGKIWVDQKRWTQSNSSFNIVIYLLIKVLNVFFLIVLHYQLIVEVLFNVW